MESSGYRKSSFQRSAEDLIRKHHPDAICFLETKASSQSPVNLGFMSILGFNNDFQVPATGFAGGLWLFLNSNKIALDILSYYTNQYIHCSFFQGDREGLVTFANVQPRSPLKARFWRDLALLAQQINLP